MTGTSTGSPWTARGVDRMVVKHLLFLAVSLAIAHTATALFVGPRELFAMIQHGPAQHQLAFGLTMGFTAVLMINFGWCREHPRLAVYGLLFLATASVLVASLALRTSFEANVLRPRGANPFVVDGERVRNVFEIHLVNKAPQAADYRIVVESPVPAEIVVATPEVRLASLASARVPIAVAIARADLGAPVELTVVVVERASGERRSQSVRFLAPKGAVPRR